MRFISVLSLVLLVGSVPATGRAQIVLNVQNGKLQVTGTAGRDVIFVLGVGPFHAVHGHDGAGNRVFKLVRSRGFSEIEVDALASNDLVVVNSAKQSTIRGGAGIDILIGGLNIDWIDGDADTDFIYGRAGRDHLDGGPGADYLRGGRDDDVLTGRAGADVLFGGSGGDEIWGHAGNDILVGNSGRDHLGGMDDNDLLLGGTGRDVLRGEDPVLPGGAPGSDMLCGGPDDDDLWGGPGDDEVYGEENADAHDGGPGVDNLYGNPNLGDRFLNGNERPDALCPLPTEEHLTSVIADAVLIYDGAVLAVSGTGADDEILVSATDRVLSVSVKSQYGELLEDQLIRSAGGVALSIASGAGNDRVTITGDFNEVIVDLGDGDDRFSSGEATVTRGVLLGGSGNDTLVVGSGFDIAVAGDGDDVVDVVARDTVAPFMLVAVSPGSDEVTGTVGGVEVVDDPLGPDLEVVEPVSGQGESGRDFLVWVALIVASIALLVALRRRTHRPSG